MCFTLSYEHERRKSQICALGLDRKCMSCACYYVLVVSTINASVKVGLNIPEHNMKHLSVQSLLSVFYIDSGKCRILCSEGHVVPTLSW